MPGYHKMCVPEPYLALTDLSASGFAWEWLRRNPDFRDIWAAAGASARRASARAMVVARRMTDSVIELASHPLERSTAPWGLTFLAIT